MRSQRAVRQPYGRWGAVRQFLEVRAYHRPGDVLDVVDCCENSATLAMDGPAATEDERLGVDWTEIDDRAVALDGHVWPLIDRDRRHADYRQGLLLHGLGFYQEQCLQRYR